MATDPTRSPFYRAANSRVEDTTAIPQPRDLIELLHESASRQVDVIDAEFEELEPIEMDEPEEIVDVEEVEVSDEFPIPEAALTPPSNEPDAPMDFSGEEAADLSSIAPAVRDLQQAMRPVDINELRQMIEAGTVGNAATDPTGERLRHTIRQLVRGL